MQRASLLPRFASGTWGYGTTNDNWAGGVANTPYYGPGVTSGGDQSQFDPRNPQRQAWSSNGTGWTGYGGTNPNGIYNPFIGMTAAQIQTAQSGGSVPPPASWTPPPAAPDWQNSSGNAPTWSGGSPAYSPWSGGAPNATAWQNNLPAPTAWGAQQAAPEWSWNQSAPAQQQFGQVGAAQAAPAWSWNQSAPAQQQFAQVGAASALPNWTGAPALSQAQAAPGWNYGQTFTLPELAAWQNDFAVPDLSYTPETIQAMAIQQQGSANAANRAAMGARASAGASRGLMGGSFTGSPDDVQEAANATSLGQFRLGAEQANKANLAQQASLALQGRGQDLTARGQNADYGVAQGNLNLGARGQDLSARGQDQNYNIASSGQNLDAWKAMNDYALAQSGQNLQGWQSGLNYQLGQSGQGLDAWKTGLDYLNQQRGQDLTARGQNLSYILDASGQGLTNQGQQLAQALGLRAQDLQYYLGQQGQQGDLLRSLLSLFGSQLS